MKYLIEHSPFRLRNNLIRIYFRKLFTIYFKESTAFKLIQIRKIICLINKDMNIALKKDGKIENIKYLTGNEKELVKFINEQYTERLLRSFFKDTIVFNIAYSSEEELEDQDMWFTFDELKEGGIIEV